MNDELLIKRVGQYEELYNMANMKYTDNTHKDLIWTKIGRELYTSGSVCKARWISLRDQLRKALRKKITKGGQITKKWKFEDNMSFVIPFFKERETQSIINAPEHSNEEWIYREQKVFEQNQNNLFENPSEDNEENESQFSPKRCKIEMPPPSPKTAGSCSSHARKTMDSDKHECENTFFESLNAHPIDLFFTGIAATVKNFSPEYQHLAKSKVFAIVSELEWTQLQNQRLPAVQLPATTPDHI